MNAGKLGEKNVCACIQMKMLSIIFFSVRFAFLMITLISAFLKAECAGSNNPELQKKSIYALAATVATVIGTSFLITGSASAFMRLHLHACIEKECPDVLLDAARLCAWLAIPGMMLTLGSITYLVKSSQGVRAKARSLWGSFNDVLGSLEMTLAAACAGLVLHARMEEFIHRQAAIIAWGALSGIGVLGLISSFNDYCLQPN